MTTSNANTMTVPQPAVAAVENDGWKELERLLPSNWIELAAANGFAMPRTEDGGPSVACRLRMMMFLVANSLSLRPTVATFAAAGIADVSYVTLHNWFRSGPEFLAALLRVLSEAPRRFDPVCWSGYLVRAVDGSSVQRPGAQGTTARVHFALQLNDMSMSQCLVTDDAVGESLRNFQTCENTLDVVDRGYSNPPSIAAAVDQGGDVLVRWNPGSLPLYPRGVPDGEPLNAWRLASSLRPGECREWRAEVRPKARRDAIDVRLIIVSLPDDKARAARARAREEHGREATNQLVFLAGFVMLVSTVPADRLTTEQLIELYRLRWQVELHFKREKSIGGLDLLPNILPDTIQSWILLKIIISELGRRILNSDPAPDDDVAATQPAETDTVSPADAPWECASLALCIIQRMLLSLPTAASAIRKFVREFLRHLAPSKSRGTRRRRRQIADFVARIARAHA